MLSTFFSQLLRPDIHRWCESGMITTKCGAERLTPWGVIDDGDKVTSMINSTGRQAQKAITFTGSPVKENHVLEKVRWRIMVIRRWLNKRYRLVMKEAQRSGAELLISRTILSEIDYDFDNVLAGLVCMSVPEFDTYRCSQPARKGMQDMIIAWDFRCTIAAEVQHWNDRKWSSGHWAVRKMEQSYILTGLRSVIFRTDRMFGWAYHTGCSYKR